MSDPVDAVLRTTLAQAEPVLRLTDAPGRAAARRLLKTLEDADSALDRKLRSEARRFGRPDARFTGAQAVAYRSQVGVMLAYVRGRLGVISDAQSRRAVRESITQARRTLARLERRFTGVASPLPVRAAGSMTGVYRRVSPSLLRQNAASMDRYGTAMVRKFEQAISSGLMGGLTQDEMIASLTGQGGPRRGDLRSVVGRDGRVRSVRERIPEGLFVRHRYWAERIVRTETAHAFNAGKLEMMFEQRNEVPDLKKKIIAVFDDRTAPDSIFVHGQVRALDETFLDGAGRVYLRPPARPNDRETLIPWREAWPESRLSRERPPSERERAQREATGNERSAAHRRAARRGIASRP